MHKAPTSGAHGTAAADISANAASFARHLRAANKAPATIHCPAPLVRCPVVRP
jgi:hypothetical protein